MYVPASTTRSGSRALLSLARRFLRSVHRRVLTHALPRFCVVGAVSAAAYVAAMSMAVEWLEWSATAGSVLAFAVGTIVSYLGNALWTFRTRPTSANLGRFLVVIGVGLVLNTSLAWLLDRLGLHYLLISLAVLIVVPAWNFAGHARWTFAAGRGPSRFET